MISESYIRPLHELVTSLCSTKCITCSKRCVILSLDFCINKASCSCARPAEWNKAQNPSFSWQLYYLWANIEVLNTLRKGRGLNTFAFRPHAGETGDVMHLCSAYMLCLSVNHGINLDKQVSLQYLYYLDQV